MYNFGNIGYEYEFLNGSVLFSGLRARASPHKCESAYLVSFLVIFFCYETMSD